MTEIAQEMNAKGLRSAFGGKSGVDVVTRMLKKRRYIGEFKCRDIVHPRGIPPIIPDELFDRVQHRMVANKKTPVKHKAEDEYLLTTKLRYGKCDCFMVGESENSDSSSDLTASPALEKSAENLEFTRFSALLHFKNLL